MKAEVKGTQIELEPNARPYLLKRLVADGFDTVLIFLLYLLLFSLLLRTPLAAAYRTHFAQAQQMAAETAEALGNDPAAVGAALSGDTAYRDELLAANLHGYLLKGGACLAAELLVLLALPLASRYRATPGKRMTGLMPFHESRQSRATKAQILYRFLFVFLFDSLGLYLLTGGDVTFLLVPVLRLTELLLSGKQQKTLCDWITGIRIIEKLSYQGIHSIQGGEKR